MGFVGNFIRVWNSLSDHLWDPADDRKQFRRDLMTYLFARHSKRQGIRGVCMNALYKSTFTYLLTRYAMMLNPLKPSLIRWLHFECSVS